MELLTTIYLHAVALSAGAVLVVHQILKFKFIPWKFANKYPVPTLILLSIAAGIVTSLEENVHPRSWTDWLILVGTIAVVAALTYNATLKSWAELRATEG